MAKENTKPVDQENEDQNPKEEPKKEFWLKRGLKSTGNWVQEHKKGLLTVVGGLAGVAGAALTLAKIGMSKMASEGCSEDATECPESGTEDSSTEITE